MTASRPRRVNEHSRATEAEEVGLALNHAVEGEADAEGRGQGQQPDLFGQGRSGQVGEGREI